MMVVIVVMAMPAPDHSIVKLNDHAVRRVHSTGIPRHDPDAVRGEPVGSGAEGLVSCGKQVQVPAILRHIG